jgi:hypothetical protein
MTLRLPLKEAETLTSAPVSAELFGFVCSLYSIQYITTKLGQSNTKKRSSLEYWYNNS